MREWKPWSNTSSAKTLPHAVISSVERGGNIFLGLADWQFSRVMKTTTPSHYSLQKYSTWIMLCSLGLFRDGNFHLEVVNNPPAFKEVKHCGKWATDKIKLWSCWLWGWRTSRICQTFCPMKTTIYLVS